MLHGPKPTGTQRYFALSSQVYCQFQLCPNMWIECLQSVSFLLMDRHTCGAGVQKISIDIVKPEMN